MIVIVFLLITCVKLLFIPAYRSTDFEVHRNWLAIAYNLPIDKWYFEDSSEWTLDYPPLFAWFEYLLSIVASWFDAKMLILDNHYYASFKTILFQRLSVMITDIFFAYGVYRCSLVFKKGWRSQVVLPILLLTNIGLLFVDHIHFQYNGMMYGFLLLSCANMFQINYLNAALWFLVLLNFKHIYLYIAPAYMVYLLRNYCVSTKKVSLKFKDVLNSISLKNTFFLGVTVISAFLITYLPFANQIKQVLSRLFPFKRGLCHAYWAPNVWAIYNVADKATVLLATKLGFNLKNEVASMTGGLVQEFTHSVLPSITPLTTMVLSIMFMLPALTKLWMSGPNSKQFVRCLVLCGLTSFLFGWHVHEKAILMVIIPLSIMSIVDSKDASIFLLLSTVGHYSLFPLLFPSSLLLIKLILLILYQSYAFYSLSNLYNLHSQKCRLPLLSTLESLYIVGLAPLFIYENFIHFALIKTLPYLPLLLTSVYCSVGVIYSWFKYYSYFLTKSSKT